MSTSNRGRKDEEDEKQNENEDKNEYKNSFFETTSFSSLFKTYYRLSWFPIVFKVTKKIFILVDDRVTIVLFIDRILDTPMKINKCKFIHPFFRICMGIQETIFHRYIHDNHSVQRNNEINYE